MRRLAVLLAALPTLAGAQALTRPKSVTIEAHVTVTRPAEATDATIARLHLPAGFRIAKWAETHAKPRVMAVAPNGDVYVSDRDNGTITLFRGLERGTSAGEVLSGRKGLHGLAIHDGRLFYAVTTDTFAAPINPDGTLGRETRIAGGLPDVGQHNDRTLAFGPDGMLYESIGSTCNECDEANSLSATMIRMTPDGGGREVFATGLRNTIGFAFRPNSNDLYGWDDGVDWLGDDAQREELNLISQGKRYGWPYVFGDGQLNLYRDPPAGRGSVADWDKGSVRPALTWTAHSSGMQLLFYTGSQFPADYRGDAFVTLHGSWNRGTPSGYEVLRVRFADGRPAKLEPFLTGFLTRDGGGWSRFARPMGLAQLPDGSLLVGEDDNGVIYRVTYAR